VPTVNINLLRQKIFQELAVWIYTPMNMSIPLQDENTFSIDEVRCELWHTEKCRGL
jgi:hypothetical protein